MLSIFLFRNFNKLSIKYQSYPKKIEGCEQKIGICHNSSNYPSSQLTLHLIHLLLSCATKPSSSKRSATIDINLKYIRNLTLNGNKNIFLLIFLLIVMNTKLFITFRNLTPYNGTSFDKKHFMENKIPPSAYS